MSSTDFQIGHKGIPLQLGLVLRFGIDESAKLARISHVFSDSVYVIDVSTPTMARYAKRPYAVDFSDIEKYLASSEWQVGRLSVSSDFFLESSDSEQAFEAIRPLIEIFEEQHALSRPMFTANIQRRADDLGISVVTLRRLVLRYYYFGRLKAALQPLKPGRHFEESSSYAAVNKDGSKPARRGPKSVIASELGDNDFVVSIADIDEMLACLEALAKQGKVTRTKAYTDYFHLYFAKRHPEKYAAFMKRKCPRPITLRQFRHYTNQQMEFTKDLTQNAGREKRVRRGATLAIGPGEYYEIDATGGRIHIVDSENSDVVLKTPLIYLIIDRWSRMIVSIYVTLRPASWEEIRVSLLIAFTSRSRRFTNLGLNVDEERWPQGRICAHLVMDRGSEMISKAMLDVAVDELHIEPETLPPICPDGKGIVERCIRALKARMYDRRLKGGFREAPLNPKTKRVFRAAKDAAALSLRDVYRELLDIVDDHNNSSHSHLETMTILKRAHVRPTPRDAYLWGLENITGLESPPLTDDDYLKLLLGKDKGSIANGVLNYRNRQYLPVNTSAIRMARQSTSRRAAIEIKVDRSDPIDIYVPLRGQDWAVWTVDKSGLQQLQEITLDEEDELSEQHRLLIAKTRDDSFINQHEKKVRLAKSKSKSRSMSTEKTRKRITEESENVKNSILGKLGSQPSKGPKGKSKTIISTNTRNQSGIELEKTERLALIARLNEE